MFFEGKGESNWCAAQVDSGLRTSKVYPASCTTFFSKQKKTIGQSKTSRTVRKRKIPAGRSYRKAGKGA